MSRSAPRTARSRCRPASRCRSQPDHVGLVCPRSGLAARDGISVLNGPGIVDPGYHGEIVVVLFSVRAQPATIKRGDRIAQLLVVPAPRPTLVVVDSLASTERGASGFGSTGR